MDPTVLAAAGALAVVAVSICAVVRVVPAGHRGVVLRAGRPARSRPSGLAVVLPGLERIVMVSLHHRRLDPAPVLAVTRDGVEVRLVLSLLWRVEDPTRSVRSVPDAATVTVDAVERAMRRLVGAVDLTVLLRERTMLLVGVPVAVQPLVRPAGVEVLDVDLVDAEVRVGAQLLRLLS